ncbi:MAG: PepSY-associated TM helix domain-containing protein [Afipia sp.]|nr:PepSY-associated TM helix domain-containing protein [Afipia sp.]
MSKKSLSFQAARPNRDSRLLCDISRGVSPRRALERTSRPWRVRPISPKAAGIFLQTQFPLHSGRILGLPGRILISAMGVIVAMLSITGIVIWARKRRARTVASPKQLARVQRRTGYS